MKNTKRDKRVKLPSDVQICDGCLNAYAKEEMHPCSCGKQFCDFCIEIHEHEENYEQTQSQTELNQ